MAAIDKTDDNISQWFAIKTRMDFRAEEALKPICDEVYFPKEYIRMPQGKTRVKAVIPHVLFVKTTLSEISALEIDCRKSQSDFNIPFWIYRYPKDNKIQIIPQRSIDLLRLLTADDTSKCRIYTAKSFTPDQRVRVTDGIYKGYEGYVRRIARNKHVVVSIEGVCMVILPFIHPDLLEPAD